MLDQTGLSSFAETAAKLKPQIDAALEAVTNYDADCPEKLREAIRYCLLAPGKRLRPMLVLMAAEACGSSHEAAMPAACAVEMIHTYSLIHDDLPCMDDDDLRRGRPTCHIEFDQATAVLAGDALLAQAFYVLSAGIDEPLVAARCCRELSYAAGPCELVGGQVDDLAAEGQPGNLEMLERIHRRKTGAMFRVSLRLGGLAGGANDEQLGQLETYGKSLGLAFQIVDDLLDREGTTTNLGKTTGKDAKHGKLTFPSLLGKTESQARAEKLIEEACQAVRDFGERGQKLCALARFVIERKTLVADHPLLAKIESAADLHDFSANKLQQLAAEIRDALCKLLSHRSAHFRFESRRC